MTSNLQLLVDLLAGVRQHQDVGDDAEVLDFVRRLPHLGPYNAALVLIQRPGAKFVASAADWHRRFGRRIKQGSNPELILVPFGPVQTMYDVSDTEGREIPDRILEPFATSGDVTEAGYGHLVAMVEKLGIGCSEQERGSTQAGELNCELRPHQLPRWTIVVSARLEPAAKVAAIFHELGHMFAGHLGQHEALRIASRREELEAGDPAMMEIEAEAIAWLLCSRVGVSPQSGKYIAGHLEGRDLPPLPLDRILSVTGRVESNLVGAEELASLLRDGQLELFRRG